MAKINGQRLNPYRTRRSLLKDCVNMGVMLTLAVNLPAISSPAHAADNGQVWRTIPSTGQQVPVIGLGTARTFNVNPDDRKVMQRLKQVVSIFHSEGGRLIDSSPMYGSAESVTGILANELNISDGLFMATKVWTRGEREGKQQIERSQQRMGGGPLELVQVHNLLDLDTQLATLREMKEDGKIRYLGVTHYTSGQHDTLARLCASENLDFVQFNYNIADRNADRQLLRVTQEHGVATLINEPFESGQLFSRTKGKPLPEFVRDIGITSWAQYFLKFITGHKGVTCAIPATSKPKHATDNMGALYSPVPDEAQRRRMLEYFNAI